MYPASATPTASAETSAKGTSVIFIPSPHWEADLDINGTSRSGMPTNFSPRDAYAQWSNRGLEGRLGQAKIPFGFHVGQSSFAAGEYVVKDIGISGTLQVRDAGTGKSTVLKFALAELGLDPHKGSRDDGECVPGVVTATFTVLMPVTVPDEWAGQRVVLHFGAGEAKLELRESLPSLWLQPD